MSKDKKRVTIGILAHVDAGKTTLSEAMLYRTGATRKLGRVDYGDTLLDYNNLEKARGITIFSGQSELNLPNTAGTLIDTPGHVDFRAEMERTLAILDYAILVISGKDGIQGHTATLWNLLKRHNVPVFVFVNKMDLDVPDQDTILKTLKHNLDSRCCRYCDDEDIATCDEELLEEYIQSGNVSQDSIAKAIKSRKVFPCYFGSALKLYGVDELLEGIDRLSIGFGNKKSSSNKLQVRIFKITRGKQGERLTHMKILNGIMRVRDEFDGEKINQIRIYSGNRYKTVEEAGEGEICTVLGLSKTQAESIEFEAVMTHSVTVPVGVNIHETYIKLKELEEEDPQLRVKWNEHLQEIQLNLMGQVQLEVLQNIISERFGIDVCFEKGHIAYKETIAKSTEGAGHYEPLRHYAEVHLLLEPGQRGSGIKFESAVSEDILDRNWQRLIMTHLKEKEHVGTLMGAPITDVKITLLAGRAHDKHTEGGDFREATYRAVRQGLRKSLESGDMILLEPFYDFELAVPKDSIGRAVADIQRMAGEFNTPKVQGEMLIINGRAPVSEMKDYVTEVASYTKGYGRLSCTVSGYEQCHNMPEIIEKSGYNPDRDMNNTADSVFCFHGAGHSVSWNEADKMMHVASGRKPDVNGFTNSIVRTKDSIEEAKAYSEDKELRQIFERTYGKSKRKKARIEAKEFKSELKNKKTEINLPECLLVDGYNIIFAWEELKKLAEANIDAAREALIETLNNYQGYKKCKVIVVFDAYKVKGGERHIQTQGGIEVVYTAEAETADTYIERTIYELSGKGNKKNSRGSNQYKMRVATSDRLEQIMVTGDGARKISAMDFKAEIEQANEEISRLIKQTSRKNNTENLNKIVIKEKVK